MTHKGAVRGLLAVLLLAIGWTAPAWATPQTHAPATAAQALRHAEEPQGPTLGPLSTSEKQAYGCLAAGGTVLALASITTGLNTMVGLFTGTTLVPATGAGLGLVAVGTVFASTCAVGALLTPGVLRLWSIYYDGAAVRETP